MTCNKNEILRVKCPHCDAEPGFVCDRTNDKTWDEKSEFYKKRAILGGRSHGSRAKLAEKNPYGYGGDGSKLSASWRKGGYEM